MLRMNTLAALVVIVIGGGAMLMGCASTTSVEPTMAPRPALINHIVFFKLKDSSDAAALIADCDARLATIPGVVSYYAGQHIDVGRANIETDYHVGFYVGFDSVEDYLGYVDHPDHVAMVQDWRPRFEWIRVWDVQ